MAILEHHFLGKRLCAFWDVCDTSRYILAMWKNLIIKRMDKALYWGNDVIIGNKTIISSKMLIKFSIINTVIVSYYRLFMILECFQLTFLPEEPIHLLAANYAPFKLLTKLFAALLRLINCLSFLQMCILQHLALKRERSLIKIYNILASYDICDYNFNSNLNCSVEVKHTICNLLDCIWKHREDRVDLSY